MTGAGRRRRWALALAALAWVVYNANLRLVVEGDSRPARLIPFVLLHGDGVALDSVADLSSVIEPGMHYSTTYWQWRAPSGHLLSIYPIVTPVLVSPLYVPAAVFLYVRGWETGRVARLAPPMEKIAASLLAALSVGLFYLLVARRLDRHGATLLTLAYAFGTATWSLSSQALWQHGMGELLVVAALLAIERAAAPGEGATAGLEPRPREDAAATEGAGARRRRAWVAAAVAGAACGLMVANRPPDGLLAVALLLGLAVAAPWRAAAAAVAAAVAAAPWAWYNVHCFGRLAGGYGAVGFDRPHSFYHHAMGAGVVGLLVSPGKGLLLFAPFLLVLLPMVRGTAWPRGPLRWIALAGAAGWVAQLLFYGRTDWRGGACYGPRFLTDGLPLLLWLLAPGVARLAAGAAGSVGSVGSARWRRVFVAAVVLAVAVQAVGAFCYPQGGSDDLYYPPGMPHLAIAPAVWSPGNFAPWIELRGGLAPPGF